MFVGNNQFVRIRIWGGSSKGVNPGIQNCEVTRIFILNFVPVEEARFQTMRKPTTKLSKQFSLWYLSLTESQYFYKLQTTSHYLNNNNNNNISSSSSSSSSYYYYYHHLLSQAFSAWYFSWTSGDPHHSGFKLHTAVLSALCVMFQV